MTDHCGPSCPFAACPSCPYEGGESGAGQRITAGQGVSRGKVGAATTNGPGRQPETALAAPIRTTEQEDYPEW